ncbi:MAG: hypothetical protein HYS18_07615 [Burkholderiales bacterium]|nr:hypothetical protein [Burkholderiales bacterium]
MGISGCTACQFGSVDALKAYERNIQVKQDSDAQVQQAQQQQLVDERKIAVGENNPTPGATVGSVINITA